MGGHGHDHIVGNKNNMQESDEAMLDKIQRIELIKFNPNHFYLDPFQMSNVWSIMGGVPAFTMGALGSVVSYAY